MIDEDAALERLLAAAESIAASFALLAAVSLRTFEKQYPAKRPATDAVITHRQTEEEKLREAQGDTDESDAEWIGPREARHQADEEQQQQRKQARRSTKAAGGH